MRFIQCALPSAICWIAALSSIPACAEEEFRIGGPLPKPVVEAWQKRREACQSVHWKLKARELVTKGLLNLTEEDLRENGPRPKQDEWRERQFEAWIDFSRSRVRVETTGMVHTLAPDGTNPLIPDHTTWLFDGIHSQMLDTRGDLLERDTSRQAKTGGFEASTVPFSWGLGVVTPPLKWSTSLMATLEAEKYRIHEVDKNGNAVILTVRVNSHSAKQGFDEYDIDLSKDAAVVRMAVITGGRLYSETRATWSQTDMGWQPVAWRDESYRLDKTLAIAGEYEVIERTCNPNLSRIEFHYVPPAGRAYLDEKSRRAFVKSPEGRPDIPKELYDIQQAARQRQRQWIMAGGAVLVSVVAALWWWRRRNTE